MWNKTKFPLTPADRRVAAMMRASGMLRSVATLDDNTPAALRPGGRRTDYYTLRCLQIALLQRFYFAMCQDKFPASCKLFMPYSTPPTDVQRDSEGRVCVSGPNGAAARVSTNALSSASTRRSPATATASPSTC